MKVSPVVGTGSPAGANVGDGRSASPDKLAAAIAIASGQAPPAPQTSGDTQVDRAQASIKRIKMRVNRSPERFNAPLESETPLETPAPEATAEAAAPESDILATGEQTTPAPEATQPVSPQLAALAKKQRALQAKEREIAAREAALAAPAEGTTPTAVTKEQIKAQLLGGLGDGSLTWDDLTQWITSQNQSTPGIEELRAEMKAMKDGLEKAQADRDQASEAQVLTYIKQDVDQLVATGDEYEMVREAGYQSKVVDLIKAVFKAEGKMMDTAEAAQEIENELLNEALRWGKLPKVQSRLTPAQVQQQQATKQGSPQTKTMRTLTNRDGVSSANLSRRERAIAAAEGRLK